MSIRVCLAGLCLLTLQFTQAQQANQNTEETYPAFYLVSGTTDTEETWFKVGRVNFILDKFAWIGSYSAYLTPEVFGKYFGPLAETPETTNRQLKLLWLGVGREDFLYRQAVTFDEYLEEKKKNRTCRDRNLIPTGRAQPGSPAHLPRRSTLATRTPKTLRPPQIEQILPTGSPHPRTAAPVPAEFADSLLVSQPTTTGGVWLSQGNSPIGSNCMNESRRREGTVS